MKRLFLLLIVAVMLMPVVGARTVMAAPAEQTIGTGYIDTWVFVDYDRNGKYSAGDNGLSDVNVCLRNTKTNWSQCVGTDQGDTWWEDLTPARYAATVDKTTVPAGYKLNSIGCYSTQTGKKVSCDTYKSTWRAYANVTNTTRINIFFALVPN